MPKLPALLLRYVSVRTLVLLLSSGGSSVAPVHKVFAAEPAFVDLPERLLLEPGQPLDLDIRVEDADGDPLLVTLETSPPWLAAVPGDTARNFVDSRPLPANYSYVEAMDVGPDGSVYLVADDAHSTSSQVVKIDAEGNHSVLVSGLWNPGHVAVGPDGTVYFTEQYGQFSEDPWYTKVWRLDRDGTRTLLNDTIDRLYDMNTDSAGNLLLLRVNPRGTITQMLKMAPADGVAHVLAGSSEPQAFGGAELHRQSIRDGSGEDALLGYAYKFFLAADDTVLINDILGNMRWITPAGFVGTLPFKPDPLTRAIEVDRLGNTFFIYDNAIVELGATGATRVVAGQLNNRAPGQGGFGTDARFTTIVASEMRHDGSIGLADVQMHEQPWRVRLAHVKFDTRALKGVPAHTDSGEWEVTLAVRDGEHVVTRTLVIEVAPASAQWSSLTLAPEPETVLAAIRATAPMLARAGAVTMTADGRLLYRDGATRMTFELARVDTSGAPAHASGIYEGATGLPYLNTPEGYVFHLRPAAEDGAALAAALTGIKRNVREDPLGVHMISKLNQLELALLPDARSQPVRAGLAQAGFYAFPHPQFAGHSYYLHVFEAHDGLREQAYYPTALAPAVLDALVNVYRPDDVRLLPQGGVEVLYGSRRFSLMPSAQLTPSTQAPGIRAAGDLNGDGVPDYRVTYPAPYGVEQTYYGLPH